LLVQPIGFRALLDLLALALQLEILLDQCGQRITAGGGEKGGVCRLVTQVAWATSI
jgi:hypothetical protein